MTKRKRARVVYAKEEQLKVAWGSDGCGNVGVIYAWGDGVPKADSWLMYMALSAERYDCFGKELPSVLDELRSRGYDIESLKLTVQKKSDLDDA